MLQTQRLSSFQRLIRPGVRFSSNLQEDTSKPTNWDQAKPYSAIPGPKPLPIIGNIWRFLPVIGTYSGMSARNMMEQYFVNYGDIVALKGIWGRKEQVYIYRPEDTEELLRNEGFWPIRDTVVSTRIYREKVRPDIYKVIGVTNTQGKDWQVQRTVLNPILMQPRNMTQYVIKIDQVSQQLVSNIKHFALQNENEEMPENFQNELYKWAFESVGVITLDAHLGCLDINLPKDSETQQFIDSATKAFDLLFKLDFFPSIFSRNLNPLWKEFIKKMDFLTEFCLKRINEADAKMDPNKPDNETSVLQKMLKKDKNIALTTAIDLLLAGVDTTGKTLGACLYFLAKHPEKQEAMRQELLTNLPDKDTPITPEILKNLKYTRAVIKEATRIAPVAIGTARTTVKDLVIRNYQIPKGTEVLTVLIASANKEEYVKKAKDFVPERWLSSDLNDEMSHKNINPFAILPFGFGPRSCIGKRMANLELEVTLAKIVRNFDMSWHKPDMVFDGLLLYGVSSPLQIRMKALSK